MSEKTISTLEQSLITIINQVSSGMDTGVAFLSAQLPDVINQVLMWHFIYNLILFILGSIILFCHAIIAYKIIKWVGNGNSDFTDAFPVIVTFSMVSLFCTMIYYKLLNLIWLKIWIAPKLWLIEYAASLVK